MLKCTQNTAKYRNECLNLYAGIQPWRTSLTLVWCMLVQQLIVPHLHMARLQKAEDQDKCNFI